MKLGLGTVQFGLDYGVSNNAGKTGRDEAKRIIAMAGSSGIEVIDTAAMYGDSETVLGAVLPSGHGFKIVTKSILFQGKAITEKDAQALQEGFLTSLARLNQAAVYGFLIHHADDLLATGGQLLMEKLQELKAEGLVKKVGVSVYDPKQVEAILDRFSIDLIQLPFNILDQRFLAGGHLAMLKQRGVEIHVRSAFLQGLLLMKPDELPPYFSSVKDHLAAYRRYLEERRVPAAAAALGFVAGIDEVDAVVCGVNTCSHLEQLVKYSDVQVNISEMRRFAWTDETIINPAKWRV